MFAVTTKVYQGIILLMGVTLIFLFMQNSLLKVDVSEAKAEKEKVIADHNLKVADMEKDLRESEAKVSSLSLNLATTISTLEAKRNDEVSKIRVSSNAIISSLQLRTTRVEEAARVPDETNSCTSVAKNGTGAGLFREDSEFLVGEATRAGEQREALRTCYGAWDSVLSTINEFNSKVASGSSTTGSPPTGAPTTDAPATPQPSPSPPEPK